MIFLVTAILLSSCTTLDAFLATPTIPVLTETPLPTATYNWFPATATPSPMVFNTQVPTPEMRPGLGDVLVTDSLKLSSLWDTATSDQGSAQVHTGQLNLAAQSKVFMYSLRHDLVLNNFYAEITAVPGLCRDNDSYGILVRANAVAYYRFALFCNGTTGVERNSNSTRQLLLPPMPSGDVPPGAPGQVRIGIWAVGTEMRLFLNGHYQFSITDANYTSGTIGVFVNSAGDTPVVVSFTDLMVQDVTYLPPTATPQP
ncbi:MAG: hypothetical protein U0Z26_07355 [Anaerolineales bacterium]